MKTIGQILDRIDELTAKYESKILNPDRAPYLCDQERHRRQELLALRKFILDEKEPLEQ
jgi:hypothetical protein